MKILFTSDLHGNLKVFRSFINAMDSHDLSIIAGEILDDTVPEEELNEYFCTGELDPDDFLPELEDYEASFDDRF